MASVDRGLDVVPPRLWEWCVPEVKDHRDREVLTYIEVHWPCRLETALEARNILPVRPEHSHLKFVRPGKLHLMQLDKKCDRAAQRSRILDAPDTGDAAAYNE